MLNLCFAVLYFFCCTDYALHNTGQRSRLLRTDHELLRAGAAQLSLSAAEWGDLEVSAESSTTKTTSSAGERRLAIYTSVLDDAAQIYDVLDQDARRTRGRCPCCARVAPVEGMFGDATLSSPTPVVLDDTFHAAVAAAAPITMCMSALVKDDKTTDDGATTSARYRRRALPGTAHPLHDRLRRRDIAGLEGPPLAPARHLPLDFLAVAPRANTFATALDVLGFADELCTRILELGSLVKHSAHLRFAALTHIFALSLPVPRGCVARAAPGAARDLCPWHPSGGLSHAARLHGLRLVRNLAEHFSAAAFSIVPTRQQDGTRLIVAGVAAAIADALARQPAIDHDVAIVEGSGNGEVAVEAGARGYSLAAFLAGRKTDRRPFGTSAGMYTRQVETAIVSALPELHVAKTHVADYFRELAIPPENYVLAWDEHDYSPFLQDEKALIEILRGVAEAGHFHSAHPAQLFCGADSVFERHCPEWEFYR